MARSPDNDLVDEIGSARAPQAAPAPVNRGANQARGAAPKKRSAGYYTIIMAFSCLICLFFYETVILLAVGMLPTGVAYLIDTHPRRYATKTVAWTNLAGALIVAFDLWGGDVSLASTIDLLRDPMNWIIMLGAAGVGWGVHFMVPGMVLRYLDLSLEMRRKSIKESQKDLEKEWGSEVRKSAPLDELAAVESGTSDDEEEEPDPDSTDGNGNGLSDEAFDEDHGKTGTGG